jgi:cyanophycinase-like exopeptidase
MINGPIALLGSGEYLPVMSETDRFLLQHCGANGRVPQVVCLPTAAGTEGEASVRRWKEMGEAHFRALGAEATSLHITNREEANDPALARQIEQADLVYFSGGKPNYLYGTMKDSRAWEAVLKATGRGAALAGCSAGAMFLGAYLPDFRSLGLRSSPAFGVLPNSHIFPHFDRMLAWRGVTIPLLQPLIPAEEYVLGLDEDTALVGKPSETWTVMGRQAVHVITRSEVKSYPSGWVITLPA